MFLYLWCRAERINFVVPLILVTVQSRPLPHHYSPTVNLPMTPPRSFPAVTLPPVSFVIPNSSPSSPLRTTTGPGTPGQTSSAVSWACSNAPVGLHTVSDQDTGSLREPRATRRVDAGALFLIPRSPLGPFLAPLFCGNSGVVLSHMLHI